MRLLILILAVVAAGCAAPQQLPPRAKTAYRYTFYGWHRRLTPYEDTRARRLFQDYIEARVKYEADQDCPCACNYNDIPDMDRMIDAEMSVYQFIDSLNEN